MPTFYLAWVNEGVTFSAGTHATTATKIWDGTEGDENVFSIEIEQSEGEFASLTAELINPRVGLLTAGRNQWIWLSADDGSGPEPLFNGRIIGVPQQLQNEVVSVQFVARPPDFIAQDDLTRALYGIKGDDTSVTPFTGATRAVRRLLDKNRDEFADDMTTILLMETAGGPQQVRIYSTRGCYLMSMLAKTALAAQFRRWVLDVLEGKVALSGSTPRLALDLPKADLPALRARTAAMNAISRSLEVICRSAGRRVAALAAPDLYGAIGVKIDLTGSDALAQEELPLDEMSEPLSSG